MTSPTAPKISPNHGLDHGLDYGFIPFFTRFQEAGDTELEIAILQWQLFCDWRDPDSATANIVLSQLGELLRLRYKTFGRPDDLHHSIDLHTRTLAVPTLRTPCVLNWFGLVLFSRGYMNGSMDDLGHASDLHEEALSMSALESDDWVSSACCLSRVLCCEDWPSADLDINRVVLLLQTALELMQLGNQFYPVVSFALGAALRRRYEILNTKEDLHVSRALLDISVDHCSFGHRERAVYLLEAGNTMYHVKNITDNRQDTEKAVLFYREAGETVSQDSPDRPVIHVWLAWCIMNRSKISANKTDLEESIALVRAALWHVSAESFYSKRGSNMLANCLCKLYAHTQCAQYLDDAIEIYARLLQNAHLNQDHRFLILINLGSAYGTKFGHDHDPEHLAAAKWFLHDALDLKAPGDFLYAFCLRTLSDFIILDLNKVEKEELDYTVGLMITVMHDYPSQEAYHWLLVTTLARVLHTRGQILQSTCDIESAMRLFTDTCSSLLVSPHRRIEACQDWIKAAEASQMADMALTAYTAAIDLLPKEIHMGLPTAIQLEQLGNTTNTLPCDAAGCSSQLGDHKSSISLLESGRTVLWTNLLRLRNTFSDLPNGLGEAMKDTAAEIHKYYSQKQGQTAAEQQSVVHQQELHTHFQDLLHQVREYPGFEDFLLPASFDKLQCAAHAGPIILLFSSEKYGSSAIVIRDEHSQPSHIPLPDASASFLSNVSIGLHDTAYSTREGVRQETGFQEIQPRLKLASSKKLKAHAPDPLSSLWNHVVLPVITHLGFKKCHELENRPRVWWCLAGKFASLPVHAAGTTSGATPGFTSDFVVSSYTPTLGALISARSTRRSNTALRTLVLAEPHAQNHFPLQNVFREVEVIESLLRSQTLEADAIQILLHPSPQEALENIGGASVVHFACHALQDPNESLSSGVLFRDSRVTVEDMMRLNIPDAFLAFLSACESAAGDQDRPDEALHLAAAMMFAGFKSVVATLWSMDDRDGPLVAEYVYRELFKDYPNVDPECIPFALDAAARKLRDDGVHWSRWATYIHMGI